MAGSNVQERRESADEVRQLVDWAVNVAASDIPAASMRRAAWVLLDDIAAMIGAGSEPDFARLLQGTSTRASAGEATVLVDGRRTDRFTAASMNAAAAGWCQLDEGFRRASCHAGLYVLPALLADAEAREAALDEVLRALVLGYEIVGRIAMAWTMPSDVVHVHARYSVIGATAGAGLVRGLPAPLLHDALNAAATLVVTGPRDQMIRGGLISNMYCAVGAELGLLACDWAERGVGGLAGTLHDVFGTILQGRFVPGALTRALGTDWAIESGFHKQYACCQRIHAGADAVLELLQEAGRPDRGRSIRRIEVMVHDTDLDEAHPINGLAARFSFPHAIAAMLVLGHAGATAFGSAAVDDPDVVALRERIDLVPYRPPRAWPHDRAVRVRIEHDDGTMLERECAIARGSPDRPLDDREIIAKASALAGSAYPRLVSTLARVAEAWVPDESMRWRDVVTRMLAR